MICILLQDNQYLARGSALDTGSDVVPGDKFAS